MEVYALVLLGGPITVRRSRPPRCLAEVEIFYLPLFSFFTLNIIFIPLFPFPLFYIFITTVVFRAGFLN